MRICDKYDHLGAYNIIFSKPKVYQEIEEVLNNDSPLFKKGASRIIKRKINLRFNELGWADKVKVGLGKSGLTISFLKCRVGVCFQIGNVSRTYADILKLSFLCNEGVIEAGVIIVPHQIEAKKMGANDAN